MTNLFPYKWYLKDGFPELNGLKMFGTFVCGGGSSMGYKLLGYESLGGVEIDKKIADVYRENLNPKYLYIEDIRDFNKRTDLPKELYDLDLLDGSPPCSTFSMAGSRERGWRKEKKFREGQALQTLDDLVFEYCNTIIKLQPKVFILENVKGIIQGNAKAYSKRIVKVMTEAGYNVQVFLFNAATMGVPQRRERVFFIGSRKDLNFPKLKLKFNERPILFKELKDDTIGKNITGEMLKYWEKCPKGNALSKVHPKGNYFGSIKVADNQICNTIIGSDSSPLLHPDKPNYLSNKNLCQIGSYPLDYNFKGLQPKYIIGMSVPPVMIAQIANQIAIQLFNKEAIKNYPKPKILDCFAGDNYLWNKVEK